MNNKFLTGTGLVVALALFLGINIIANNTLTSQRLDVTAGALHTLSDGTRNILKAIDEPITIRFYFSAKQFTEAPEFATHGKRVRDLLEEYVAASRGKIKLLVIDPEPFSETEDQAAGFGIQAIPAQRERGKSLPGAGRDEFNGRRDTDPNAESRARRCAGVRPDKNGLHLVESHETGDWTAFRIAGRYHPAKSYDRTTVEPRMGCDHLAT